MKLKIIIPLGLVVLLAAVVAYKILGDTSGSETRRQNIPVVIVEKPLREKITQRIQLTGDVIAVQQASIFSKVSGTLDRVYANIGSKVRVGQLLALIDTTELTQQVQQTAATFFNARATYERTKQLLQGNLVSKQDLDNADALMRVAEANYANAQTRLGYAWITAPFSGTVSRRFMDPGAVVTTPTNATLFSLVRFDTVKVVVNILEKDIATVHVGTQASVTADAFPGTEFSGLVARLSQAIDPATRTMTAEIDIPNQNLLLRPGMYADVLLRVAERPNQISVPTQSLLRDDNGYYVYVVQNNAAHRVKVNIGVEQGGRTEIFDGLQDNASLIVMGQQLVKDGGQVRVQ